MTTLKTGGQTVLRKQGAWLEKARSLAPLVEKYRDEGERERRLPQPLITAARDLGLMRMLMPRALGGAQADLNEALQVYEELARHDGGCAWAIMILSGTPILSDYFSADVAREIFVDGECITAGNLGPTGRAEIVPGGYRVSGQWPFASGCHQANWINGGCTVFDGDSPRVVDGQPERRLVMIPAAECRILDTWHTAGLRASGSHDVVAEDVFVPMEHTFPHDLLRTGPAERPGLGYPYPFPAVGRTVLAAIAFGIARDAIDSFKELAATKVIKRGIGNLNSRHTVHEKLGRAEALLRSARLYTHETLRRVTATPPSASMEDLQLATAFSVESAIHAVDIMFETAGGSSVYETSRLERCFRDVHMVSHHMAVSPLNIELAGQYFLGTGAAGELEVGSHQ